MANGVAALHLAPEPTPAKATAEVPDEIEVAIGVALAGLAGLAVQSIPEIQANGRISPTVKAAGGRWIAELYEARQLLGATAFASVARQQGRLQLTRQRWSEAVIDEITAELIAVVVRVDATMRAWAN